MNDVHFLDLNDPNNPCWYKMTIDDSNEMVPAPRWRHTATAISESEMLVLLSVQLFLHFTSVWPIVVLVLTLGVPRSAANCLAKGRSEVMRLPLADGLNWG